MSHQLAEIEVNYDIYARTETKAISKAYRKAFQDVPEGRELTTEYKDIKELEDLANKPTSHYIAKFSFTIELDDSLAGVSVHNVDQVD